MWGYINKTAPGFTIHYKTGCGFIPKNKDKDKRKEKQKHIEVNNQNYKEKLPELENDPHPFSESVPPTDMWIEINLSSPQQNEDFFNKVREILVKKYPRRFAKIFPKRHCKS